MSGKNRDNTDCNCWINKPWRRACLLSQTPVLLANNFFNVYNKLVTSMPFYWQYIKIQKCPFIWLYVFYLHKCRHSNTVASLNQLNALSIDILYKVKNQLVGAEKNKRILLKSIKLPFQPRLFEGNPPVSFCEIK